MYNLKKDCLACFSFNTCYVCMLGYKYNENDGICYKICD